MRPRSCWSRAGSNRRLCRRDSRWRSCDIRQGDLANAKQELDAAAQAAPDNPEVGAVLGFWRLRRGAPEDAVAFLQKAESQLPNRLGVTLALARAQLAADATGCSAYDSSPSAGGCASVFAIALYAWRGRIETRERSRSAVDRDSRSKAEYPTRAAGTCSKADAQIARGVTAAAADPSRRRSVVSRHGPCWCALIGALQLAGQPADALRATERWVAANPKHVLGTLTLGRVPARRRPLRRGVARV